MRRAIVIGLGSVCTAILFASVGCGSQSGEFDPVYGGGYGGPMGGGADNGNGPGFDRGDGGSTPTCTNLECKQVACPNGGSTTVSGVVYDPGGNNPLYNVAVYVPNAPVAPMTHGATCDKCGSTLSGNPVVTALTDPTGHFVLKNVPVGDNIPLVIQVGKWRRQVVVPHVAQCADTPMLDKNVMRLPRNGNEGDLPRIALTTGGADELECLFRSNKIGLDESEFSAPGGAGHVHLYGGTDGSAGFVNGARFPVAQQFWSNVGQLMQYDIVVLSCEGNNEHLETKPQLAIQAMHDYATAGGRIFASHWHMGWFRLGFPEVGTFDPSAGGGGDISARVDQSFPKGAALQQWLGTVGALNGDGTLPIKEAKTNLLSVTPPAQTWISEASGNPPEYMSFNTPTNVPPDQACGRAVYSNLHVSAGDEPNKDWPSGCITSGLSPQEKALEFMLFDLAACVQADKTPPAPPPPVR